MLKHAERRVLPFTPEQMYDLVAAVDKYPEFLPWCMGARIRKRQPGLLVADLLIGFKVFRERFTSRVTLDQDNLEITVDYLDGPMKHLINEWQFLPHEQGCEVNFFVEFEFRSIVLQKAIGALFTEAVKRMVAAFEARAYDLYGDGSSS